MTTRTILGTLIFTIGFTIAGFSQNYHPAFRSMAQLNTLIDSIETPHLRVSVQQPDKDIMKFRISFVNPNARRATIIIRKKDDIYFYETIGDREYASLYDFDQLEDGDYQVVVTGGKEKVSASISIRTRTQVNRQAQVH